MEVAVIISQSHFGSANITFHREPPLGVVASTILVGPPAFLMQGPQTLKMLVGAKKPSSRMHRETLE